MKNYSEEVEKLISYAQNNLLSNLPNDYKPPDKYICHCSSRTLALILDTLNRLGAATVDTNGILSLPLNMILSAGYPKLIVRDSYIKLAWKVFKKSQNSLILGPPGVGKSVFICFLLYILIKAKIPFVYDFAKHVAIYNGRDIYEFERIFFDSCGDLDDRNIFYLHDSSNEPSISLPFGSTIACSNQEDPYPNFQKKCTKIFYMPLWDADDLLRLCETIPEECKLLKNNTLKEVFEIACENNLRN